MSTIDSLADDIMAGLQEYVSLANDSMKEAVKKTATSVKKEISANAPKDTGAYGKSWKATKTSENSHTLKMTVHSKDVAAVGYQENRTLLLRKKTVYSCWSI